jgi:lipopolysaccharide biosynthesis regulator YciM
MFRFTIRELVLLTLVVAMGVAWWLDRSQLKTERDDARVWKKSDFDKLQREVQSNMEKAMREFAKTH